METIDFPAALDHPFTLMVCGPTRSGKTEWTKNLILNAAEMISPAPMEIILCFAEKQPAYEDLKGKVRLMENQLPNEEVDLKATPHIPKLLIIDDMQDQLNKDGRLTHLFKVGCHHWSCSLILLCQTIFQKGGNQKDNRGNSHYLVLMNSPSDMRQIIDVAKDMYPGNNKYFMESYQDATSKEYGYLFVDRTGWVDRNIRLRTNIFPQDPYCIVYMPKKL